MEESYIKELEKAKENKESIGKLFNLFKKKKNKNLDADFHKAHIAAFREIDCLKCANCCKTTSPIFRDVDIKRISKNLKMQEVSFIMKYLRMDEENDYVLKSSPCIFLDEENYCTIYEFRPLACREYPHTDRKNMHQIMDLTLKNTEVCPAVAKITNGFISNK